VLDVTDAVQIPRVKRQFYGGGLPGIRYQINADVCLHHPVSGPCGGYTTSATLIIH